MARVSVIIPTYNRDYIIEQSIQSVLDQTYTDFELIVVDDGSTDDTSELVEAIVAKDKRVKLIHTPGNLGAAGARNFGIQYADGELIAFEDSDDFWTRDKLKKCVEALDSVDDSYGFAYHEIKYDFGEGAYAIMPDQKMSIESKSGDIFAQTMYDNLVACPAMVIKKKYLDQAGLFDTELKALEDYDLTIRLTKLCKAVFVPEVLLNATYSEGSVSRNTINYLTASCMLIGKYKSDYLSTNTFNHRIEVILRDAERVGLKNQYIELIEKIIVM